MGKSSFFIRSSLFALAVILLGNAGIARADTVSDSPSCSSQSSTSRPEIISSGLNLSADEASALSEESVAELGLPPRPVDKDQFQAWLDEVNLPRVENFAPCESVLPDVQGTTYTSNSHWSGYVATSAPGSYVGVQGNLTVPQLGSSGCLQSDSSFASWVGIGGYGTASLVQGGIFYYKGVASPFLWYEYLGPTNHIYVTQTNGAIKSGDRLHIWVNVITSTSEMHFGFTNYSTGITGTVTIPIQLTQNYDGSSVEWIDERPVYQNSISSLDNFGVVNWTNALAERDNFAWYNVGTQATTQVTMVNGLRTLTNPSALLSSTSFNDFYVACS